LTILQDLHGVAGAHDGRNSLFAGDDGSVGDAAAGIDHDCRDPTEKGRPGGVRVWRNQHIPWLHRAESGDITHTAHRSLGYTGASRHPAHKCPRFESGIEPERDRHHRHARE
jgi:hypothetical protein